MPEFPHRIASPHRGFASRRDFLRRTGSGFGALALAALMEQTQARGDSGAKLASNPLASHPGHFPARAKSVIWLFMNGGPSQVDTWDYKPELGKKDGQELKGFDKDTGFFTDQVGPLMKSPFKFAQHGQSGTWASEIFPKLASHVDDMAMIYSCYTHTNNHSPALFEINTGMSRMGFPCVGSWVTYGLGTENQNLPAFVAMYDTLGRGVPKGHAQNWGAGFLPGVFQGTALNAQGAPMDNLDRGIRPNRGRATRPDRPAEPAEPLDTAKQHPRRGRPRRPDRKFRAGVPDADGRSRGARRPPRAIIGIQTLYGIDDPKCSHFAKQCLMARRLVERGVRFVQIYSGGMENERSWDGHTDIAKNHAGFAGETDKPIAALLTDLKASGLLDSTLVICNGEFGRLPIVQKGGHRAATTTRTPSRPGWPEEASSRELSHGSDRRDRPQGRRGSREHQ